MLVSAIAVLFLPETKGKVLENTIKSSKKPQQEDFTDDTMTPQITMKPLELVKSFSNSKWPKKETTLIDLGVDNYAVTDDDSCSIVFTVSVHKRPRTSSEITFENEKEIPPIQEELDYVYKIPRRKRSYSEGQEMHVASFNNRKMNRRRSQYDKTSNNDKFNHQRLMFPEGVDNDAYCLYSM